MKALVQRLAAADQLLHQERAQQVLFLQARV